jgi:hypothetical protein
LRTIATVDDRNAVPHILDGVILEQRGGAARSGSLYRRGRLRSRHRLRLSLAG